MSLPPESIQVGQCYLTSEGHVRRVLLILPSGVVQFEQRLAGLLRWARWRAQVADLRTFAAAIERQVPCDWTPETDG